MLLLPKIGQVFIKYAGGNFRTCIVFLARVISLFPTCDKPFSYITDESTKVLNSLQDVWQSTGDGPLITMDAGPNIHLLYREDQSDLAHRFKAEHLVGNYDVL